MAGDRGQMYAGHEMPGTHFAITDIGRRRKTNQDSAYSGEFGKGWTLLVMGDGVGGAPAGDVASREAVTAIRLTLETVPLDDPAEALRRALAEANRHVLGMAADDPALEGMSTTAVIALVRNGQAWVAGIGDSRGYVLEQGVLRQVTEDDSLVAEQVRAGYLTEEEAEQSPFSNVITRCIGSEEPVPAEDVEIVTLGPGTMVMLASDGLFKAVSPTEMASLMRQGSVEEVARALVERANANGGPDNIGVAVYREDVETATE